MFLAYFQAGKCLIPFLFERMSDLVRSVLLCFIPSDAVGTKEGKELLDIAYEGRCSQLDDKSLSIGETTKHHLSRLSDFDRQKFLVDVRSFYAKITERLFHYFRFDDSNLKFLTFLHPLSSDDPAMRASTLRIARMLSNVILPDELDLLDAELREYSTEMIAEDVLWINEPGPSSQQQRHLNAPEKFWSHIGGIKNNLTGVAKFPLLYRLAKACLSIPHGNADVERGFSRNKNTVTQLRTWLGEDTINASRKLASYMKCNHYNSWDVPIPHELRGLAKSAYSRYLDAMRKEKEEERLQEQQRRAQHLLQIQQASSKEQIDKDSAKLQEQKKESLKLREKAQENLKCAEKLLKESKMLDKKSNTLEKRIESKKRKKEGKGILKFLKR